MKKEIWRPIAGYEGLYEVSSMGNVRTSSGRILKLEVTQRGYLRVGLWKDGGHKKFRVHRLVAIAFIPNPLNLPQVDHINGDKKDNRVENLRWTNNIRNCNYDNKKELVVRPIVATFKNGSVVEYPSIRAAAREIGVSRYGIMASLSGTQKTTANGTVVAYGD